MNKLPIREPLGPLLIRTSRAVGKMLQQMFVAEGHDLSADEWALLINLKLFQDGQFQQQLADRIFKDKAAITRLVDGLGKKGLVCRMADDKDRRQKKVYLSRTAEDLVQQLFPVARTAQVRVQQGITPEELKIFRSVLNKIFANAAGAK